MPLDVKALLITISLKKVFWLLDKGISGTAAKFSKGCSSGGTVNFIQGCRTWTKCSSAGASSGFCVPALPASSHSPSEPLTAPYPEEIWENPGLLHEPVLGSTPQCSFSNILFLLLLTLCRSPTHSMGEKLIQHIGIFFLWKQTSLLSLWKAQVFLKAIFSGCLNDCSVLRKVAAILGLPFPIQNV